LEIRSKPRGDLCADGLRKRAAEITAENLSKAGWSWGCVSAVDSAGRTIFVADAHRGDGKRFVVRAVEKLTAFLEVESPIREASGKLLKDVFVEGGLSCDLNRAAKNISRLQNSPRVYSLGATYEKSSSASVCCGARCCLFCSGDLTENRELPLAKIL
jgi:hypothetical protein